MTDEGRTTTHQHTERLCKEIRRSLDFNYAEWYRLRKTWWGRLRLRIQQFIRETFV